MISDFWQGWLAGILIGLGAGLAFWGWHLHSFIDHISRTTVGALRILGVDFEEYFRAMDEVSKVERERRMAGGAR